jgi:toxin ParE1/3/4
MLPVVWLDSAVEDLGSIVAFIAEVNLQAADRLAAQLIEDADNLGVLPAQYRRGRVAGTHEFVSHPNYVLVYRRTLTVIEVLNVIHARQQYPS